MSLTATPPDAELTTVTVDVGAVSKTFNIVGGLSATAASFGVYIPSDDLGSNELVAATAANLDRSRCYQGTAPDKVSVSGDATASASVDLRLAKSCAGGAAGAEGAAGSGFSTGTAGASGPGGANGAAGSTGGAGANGAAGTNGAAGASAGVGPGPDGGAGVGEAAGQDGGTSPDAPRFRSSLRPASRSAPSTITPIRSRARARPRTSRCGTSCSRPTASSC